MNNRNLNNREMEKEKIKEFVTEWMKTYGKDTFIPNKHGNIVYYSENKVSGINLVCFFEDLVEDVITELKKKEDNKLKQVDNDALLAVVYYEKDLPCSSCSDIKTVKFEKGTMISRLVNDKCEICGCTTRYGR